MTPYFRNSVGGRLLLLLFIFFIKKLSDELNYDSDNYIPHLSIRITVNTDDQGSVVSSRTQVIGPTRSTKPQVPGQ